MAGAYRIYCLNNNKAYIGHTSKKFTERFEEHLGALRKNDHYNYKIQEDFNLFGQSAFLFEILEVSSYTDKELLKLLEKKWTDKHLDAKYELYNIKNVDNYISKEDHPMYGRKHSEETKRKWSEKRNGSTIPDERKQRISDSTKGTKNPRAKLTESDCLKIKQYLISLRQQNPDILWKSIEEQISDIIGISTSQIAKIRRGIHWSNKELLNGSYNDWIKEMV